MDKPTPDILSKFAPLSMWEQAEKQARRSTFKLFKTGCVMFDKNFKLVSRGCSHPTYGIPPRPAVHSEQDALRKISSGHGLTCVVVTINRTGNYAGSSKPCAFCTHILHKAGIERVIYAERANDGTWTVNNETLESLISRVDCATIHERYTKQMHVA